MCEHSKLGSGGFACCLVRDEEAGDIKLAGRKRDGSLEREGVAGEAQAQAVVMADV